MSYEDRFVSLETKIAFQEDLLQSLNEAIVGQNDKISALEARCESLLERLTVLSVTAGLDPDERPPHY